MVERWERKMKQIQGKEEGIGVMVALYREKMEGETRKREGKARHG